MATILPFQGIRYNPKRVKDLSRVVSPPYDVISKEDQHRYYQASPYNVIRLELGKTFSGDNGLQNRYKRAKTFFDKWLSRDVLIQDKEPSFYLYEHTFKKGKARGRRIGFLALLNLGDDPTVHPHEKTFPSPKEDRFLLLQTLQTNVSPLFFLFPDRKKQVKQVIKKAIRHSSVVADFSSGSENHKVWRLSDPLLIKKLRISIARHPLFIADGHHRYEVARTFHKKMKGKTGHCVMAYFASLSDLDLVILPIHRIVRGLSGDFETLRRKLEDLFSFKSFSSVSALLREMERKGNGYVLGLHGGGKSFYLLTLKNRKALSPINASVRRSKTWRRLDVTLLHELVLKKKLGFSESALRKNVLYCRDADECVREVRQKNYQAVFFLRPVRIGQIERIARLREKVPQKSTYFYPKPLTGLVMYRLEEGR